MILFHTKKTAGVQERRGPRAGRSPFPGWTSWTSPLRLSLAQLAGRLAGMQVAAFTALEVSERLRSGIPVGEMFHNHLFPIGIAIQLVVACVGALLLRWLARAAEAIGSLFGRRPVARRPRVVLRRPQILDIPACSPL